MPVTLPDLADLEWLLRDDAAPLSRPAESAVGAAVAREHELSPAELRRRADNDRELRHGLAGAWLAAVRKQRDDLPGFWLGRGLWLVGLLLLGLGLLTGGGAASALLAYDGSEPVNVLPFLAFFCLLQIVLLVVLAVFLLRSRGGGGGPGLLHRPIAWLAQRLGGRRRSADLAAALRTLHTRRGVYSAVERWSLFTLAQRFGVAFNVGALLVALHAIVFSDLVFSWSTTLALEPSTVHGIARGLALPWSFVSSAVVDLDAVTASQWARMPGAFVAATTPADALILSDQWWRFLVAGLVTYGLLPRVLAFGLGAWCERRALKNVRLDHVAFQDLFDRLLLGGSGWQGPEPASVVGPAPMAGQGPATPHAPTGPGTATAAVAWGSIARRREQVVGLVGRRFGGEPVAMVTAGAAELDADQAALAELRACKAGRVAFVAAAGHQPTRDVIAFVERLRNAVGETTPIVIGLVDFGDAGEFRDAEADERSAWQRSLGALDDAYLWVEAMGAKA
ncbi:MAG: DUF2868 domain-containing protein [bacterium]|nr:DUF2868 domain-containing protein [bacterium]